MKKTFKRFAISLLLIASLSMPVVTPVNAAESSNQSVVVDAAIVFADLHTNQNDYKDSHIQAVMGSLKNTGLPFSSVTSGGDAFSVCDDDHHTFPFDIGITSRINKSIQSGLNNYSIPINYVWSDHDRYADIFYSENMSAKELYDVRTSRFVYGAGADGIYGNYDDDNYYVYALSMADTTDKDRYLIPHRSEEQILKVINDFKNQVACFEKDKPVFVVAHQPLFSRRNDNGYAYLWYEALDEIGKTMDVTYFFGHNHSYDKDYDYFYGKGDDMRVATPDGGKQSYENMNFTHICAGYMEPTSTNCSNETTREGTALAITIYEDSIRYTTYDKYGQYYGKYALDTTVERDSAQLTVGGKTSYVQGDDLALKIIYGGKDVSNDEKVIITGYDKTKLGSQRLTISYKNSVRHISIFVSKKTYYNTTNDITIDVTVPASYKFTINKSTRCDDLASGLFKNFKGYSFSTNVAPRYASYTVSIPNPCGSDVQPVVYRFAKNKKYTKIDNWLSADGKYIMLTTGNMNCDYYVGEAID